VVLLGTPGKSARSLLTVPLCGAAQGKQANGRRRLVWPGADATRRQFLTTFCPRFQYSSA